jgi:hypothetical protein
LLCGEIARNVTDMAATRQLSRHALQASRGVCQANDGASYSPSATLSASSRALIAVACTMIE